LQGGEKTKEEELGEERYPSALPFLPPMTDATISLYFQFYFAAVGFIIVFGGLLSPILEVRLGIGGVHLFLIEDSSGPCCTFCEQLMHS
jgi:hypothetical protein